MSLVELNAQTWLQRVQEIESGTITPWPKVAKNIFGSLQWTGKDAVIKSQRKYYGLKIDNQIVASLEIYYLSETTIRVRGLYCNKTHRRKGYMKTCLTQALEHYRGKASRAVTFATPEGMPFYLRVGFEVASSWQPRNLEYFDFSKNEYVVVPDDHITLLHKSI